MLATSDTKLSCAIASVRAAHRRSWATRVSREHAMYLAYRRLVTHPLLALGSTLLCGLVEVLALWRARRRA